METADPTTFGDLLKRLRKRQHITQAVLAAQLGQHPNTLSKWERGINLPESKSKVQQLAYHLGLPREKAQHLYDMWVLGRLG